MEDDKPVMMSAMRSSLKLHLAIAVLLPAIAFPQSHRDADWAYIGGSPQNTHYSPLREINRSNVSRLQVAWRFETGEPGGLETTPLIIDGVLFGITPSQKIFALDAASGKLLWKFDSGVKGTAPDRGLTYWKGTGNERRLFVGVMNFIYALDPETGKVIPGFGQNGRIDLRQGLGRDPERQSIALTSPAVLYKNLLIVGGRLPETSPAPPGDIRAFDVHTGAQRWVFHTIPHPGEPGYSTWPPDPWKTAGGANNWAGMAVDPVRGIVYVPTGSAVPDFYGASRLGDDLYANCLLALDAATGKLLWHFQGVHHDLWDRDFPSPPALATITRNGKKIDAVAQTTKLGTLYLFDRTTGRSLFPIEEQPAAPSTIPGEVAAKTQPHPLVPEPFAPQTVTEATLTNRTPAAHAWAVQRLRELRNEGAFVPFTVGKDTLLSPSFEGGAEWGGAAFDPQTGILYVNANNYASLGGLAAHTGDSPGRATYVAQCSVCHGDHRQGSPPEFPSLLGITHRLTKEQITATVHQGKDRMPAFPFDGKQLTDLLDYLATPSDTLAATAPAEEQATNAGHPAVAVTTKYTMTGYRRFNDPDGYPATAPPWGTLNALDLATGKYLWKISLGEYPELAAEGMDQTGSENYGGPLVTAGGVLFIAATNFDHKIRAFDKTTGKLLWESVLPFAGNASPATYQVHGRQYVVIAAGGSRMNPRGQTGGVYVAFALPK